MGTTDTARVKRGFADLPHGQVHYRHAGSGDPILLLHASPGSSRQIEGIIRDLAGEGHVFAPDTPGNGDSPPIGDGEPTIAALGAAALRFMDAMGLDRVRLYGSHTGAAIAAELAILAPDRVSALVLDGVSVLTEAEQDEILAHYAFPFTPDREGAYLMRIFQFCRDQYLFFPWYERTREARRDSGLGSAQDIHAWVTEVMKACETYHLNYRAAFRYPAGDRLPLLRVPTLLIAAETDPLVASTEMLTPLVEGGRFERMPRSDAPGFAEHRRALIAGFFAAPRPEA